MQEINLLQNKVKDRTLQFDRSNRIVLVVFSLILVLEIGGFVGLQLLTSAAKTQTTQIQVESQDIKKAMDSNQKELPAAKGLQAQLKNVTSLVGNHIYWTEFLDQVSAVVPNKIRIISMNLSASDDQLHVEGAGQSYQEIGRLLLSLNRSDKFTDVKLHSVVPSDSTAFGYSFSMDLKVNPSIFKKTK